MSRPALPFEHANPNLQSHNVHVPLVKYQTLDRDGQDVLVGRIKVSTPTGHAFILRRFDTGAVSLTTMFRAAFPTASETSERREMTWAKEAYDLSGNNGSTREPTIVRLAGTWIDAQTALLFADEYAMVSVIKEIVGAVPDPQVSHRRASSRPSVGGGLGMTPVKSSPMVKRRREAPPSSPAVHASPAATATTTTTATVVKSVAPSPLRQALRAHSPLATSKLAMGFPAAVAPVATLAGSDDTAVEEEDAVATSARPDMATDVAEQKQLIEELKAQRAAAAAASAADVAETNDDNTAAAESEPKKRTWEEEEQALQFNFKERDDASSTAEIEALAGGDRQIATNKRVSRWKPELGAKQKSAAWGALAFAAGMTAMTFLPNLF